MSASKKTTGILWTAQSLLAVLFLFAGSMKLIMPAVAIEQFAAQTHTAAAFLRFIGICETLGGLGLILPGLFKIRPGLTPLAAVGLVVIMTGAVTITLLIGGGVQAVPPAIIGAVLLFIAYGRTRLAPQQSRRARQATAVSVAA
jgi:uncharacterized membrane protein YphA (DoxX/SURF4 family)